MRFHKRGAKIQQIYELCKPLHYNIYIGGKFLAYLTNSAQLSEKVSTQGGKSSYTE